MTRAGARAEATWWRRERASRMAAYRCPSCGSWHVGNNRRKPVQRARRRRGR